MEFDSLHTKIIEIKDSGELTIIRESSENYPKGKSNIYARNKEGNLVWITELPLDEDIYCNPILWEKGINPNAKRYDDFLKVDRNSLVVSSWKGFTVSIDNRNGKILHKEFTK